MPYMDSDLQPYNGMVTISWGFMEMMVTFM